MVCLDWLKDDVVDPDEYSEWAMEIVEIDAIIVGMTSRAIIAIVDDEKFFVGQSVIDNLDDILAWLNRKARPRSKEMVLQVPRWVAHNNGWNY